MRAGFLDSGLEPFDLGERLLVQHGYLVEQVLVRYGLGYLAQRQPVNVRLLSHQVELAQVAKQQQPGFGLVAEQFRALVPDAGNYVMHRAGVRGLREIAAEPLGDVTHRFGVLVTLRGECVAHVVDVVFGGLPFGSGAVFGGECGFGVVELAEQQADLVHGDAPV